MHHSETTIPKLTRLIHVGPTEASNPMVYATNIASNTMAYGGNKTDVLVCLGRLIEHYMGMSGLVFPDVVRSRWILRCFLGAGRFLPRPSIQDAQPLWCRNGIERTRAQLATISSRSWASFELNETIKLIKSTIIVPTGWHESEIKAYSNWRYDLLFTL